MNQTQRKEIMRRVYAALMERGYRPNDQIIGYILTGDPVYITNHKGARLLVADIDRYDLLQDLLQAYLTTDVAIECPAFMQTPIAASLF